MPLFIRALPLSLGTLWHYVFLLPFVVIVCVPFLMLTFLPLIGFMVSSAIGTFSTFAGYRCAITAFGSGNEPSFTKLVMSSLSLGFLNTLAGIVILLISLGVGTGLIRLGVGAVLWMLWRTCWFSATAVLAWDRISQKQAARRVETVDVAKVSPEDLRALRESRTPGSQ